jgi:hypothetical protein
MNAPARTSEGNLWSAVIAQAIQDATSPYQGKDPQRYLDKQQARSWLTTPSAQFSYVCDLAGFHPDQVRKLAIRLIAETDATPPGEGRRLSKFMKTPVTSHNARSSSIGKI